MASFQSPQPGRTRGLARQTPRGTRPATAKRITGARPLPHSPLQDRKSHACAAARQYARGSCRHRHYVWHGKFDRVKLHDGFIQQFGSSPHFDTSAIPHLEVLVGYIENDTRVTDIRWMACMLATAYWETTSLAQEAVTTLDKHHKPMFDKKASRRSTADVAGS